MFQLIKTNKNKLFTPSLLIFLTILIYFFSTQNFLEKNYQYAYILGITGVFLAVKIFFLAFLQVEKYTSQQKWISLVIDLILVGFGWGFCLAGVNHLSQNKFPDITLWFFFLANLSFLSQLFLARLIKPQISFWIILIYTTFILILNRKWFINGDQILTQQFIAYSVLILEIIVFLFITRITLKGLREKNLS